MAISQSKYIRISSSASNTALGSRDFSGLVFTKTAMKAASGSDSAHIKNIKKAYGTDGSVVGLTLSDVSDCFASTTDEYKFAVKYFSYVGRDGGAPTVLNFKLMGTADTPSGILAKVNDITNNFGSFTFLGTFDDTALAGAAGVNSGYDHRYLFCVGKEYTDTAAASTTMAKYSDAVGTFVYFGADKYGAAIPMAMLASINFGGRDSTICFMFKQIAGEEATIANDTDYESMKEINANFYGLTQTNGTMFAFIQRGYNSNGEDTGTYCNEMWLKSSIATSFLDLCLRVNKIPVDTAGMAMVRATILGNISTAINNGTILIGKPLDDLDRARIFQYTKDESAADNVIVDGYWLDVVFEKDESDDWIAKYYLVYAKGDGIRFCDGSHKLV